MLSIRRAESTTSSVGSSAIAQTPLNAQSATLGPSVIGADLRIVGNIMSAGELHIEGTVQGDIQGVKILVRNTAKITGTISGQDVILHGAVIGSVKADRIVLAASCRLEGDVFHQSLSIEQGAYFEGKSRRGSPQGNGAASNRERPPFVVDAPNQK